MNGNEKCHDYRGERLGETLGYPTNRTKTDGSGDVRESKLDGDKTIQ